MILRFTGRTLVTLRFGPVGASTPTRGACRLAITTEATMRGIAVGPSCLLDNDQGGWLGVTGLARVDFDSAESG